MSSHSSPSLKNKKSICLGITPWKRANFLHFVGGASMASFMALSRWEQAVERAMLTHSRIICWSSSIPEGLETRCKLKGVELVLVEDGFIRSSGLGIKLAMPASLCFSRKGIHYDATRPSELEEILSSFEFTEAQRLEGKRLIEILRHKRVSKYNIKGKPFTWPTTGTGRKIVVIGQVEDDASIALGSPAIQKNLDFLVEVRRLHPDAQIVYRPHPDVSAGLRLGAINDKVALEHCDFVSRKGDIFSLIEAADEVHVLSSQTGLEALLMGRKVVCYGQPFYSGWGLTTDINPNPRRKRSLKLCELIYGAMIHYPRYIDPDTGAPSNAFDTIDRILSHKKWPQAPRSYMIAVWFKRKLRGFKKKKKQVAA